ncbi:MAG: hypothetical protein FWF10_00435 [Clostridiales bacterium]|nr:hypothetical protein [Clostridiales bacterium]
MNAEFDLTFGQLDISMYETNDVAAQRCLRMVLAKDTQRPRQAGRLPARRVWLVIIAALFILLLGTGVLAAATGGFADARERAREQAENFDYDATLDYWRNGNWTPWALVDMQDGTAPHTVTWVNLMLFTQMDPDYYLNPYLLIADGEKLHCLQEDVYLYADGIELAYCTDTRFEAPFWSGACEEDGSRIIDAYYLYENKFEPGTEFRFTGIVRDASGTPVSEWDITFTLTQAAIDARNAQEAARMAEADKEYSKLAQQMLESFPESSVLVEWEADGVTLEEIGLQGNEIYYSMRLPSETLGYNLVSYNGVIMETTPIEIVAADGSVTNLYKVFMPADCTTETARVILFRNNVPGMAEIPGPDGFAVDVNWRKGTASPCKNSTTLVQEAQAAWEQLLKRPPGIEIGHKQRIGHIDVTLVRIEQNRFGWELCFLFENELRDFHCPQEYSPSLVKINGVEYLPGGAFERYTQWRAPADENYAPWGFTWTLRLPFSINDISAPLKIEVVWDIYDRNPEGYPEFVGTFTFAGEVAKAMQ